MEEVVEMSIVRNNLMTREGYSPYCGDINCRKMPRTRFDGGQFVCDSCGWRSEFPGYFIKGYKKKWGIGNGDEKCPECGHIEYSESEEEFEGRIYGRAVGDNVK